MSLKMRGGLPLLAVALILCFAGTVAAQDVRYNARPDTDFTKYKTYKWVKIEKNTYPDAIADQQIMAAVDAALAAKGFTKTDDEKADMYVAYQVALSQEKEWNTYGMGMGWGGYGPGWGYGGGGMTTTSTSTIYVGMLGLDIYDQAARQLIWRGSASKTLDEKAKPEKREKNLKKATQKLLKNFPPPAKKK